MRALCVTWLCVNISPVSVSSMCPLHNLRLIHAFTHLATAFVVQKVIFCTNDVYVEVSLFGKAH